MNALQQVRKAFSEVRLPAPLWVALGLLVALAYLLPFPYYQGMNNPNENVRVYMTRAIVEHGTESINAIESTWGYVNDKAIYEGRLYPGKAPGSSYMAVPTYWVYFHWIEAAGRSVTRMGAIYACRLGASLLPTLLFMVVYARMLLRELRSESAAVFGVVTLALGSTMFPYAMLASSHAAAAAALFGGFLAIRKHVDLPRLWWPPTLAGLLLGAGVALEYPVALGGIVVALYGLIQSKNPVRYCFWGIFGAIPPIALLMGYHANFGGIMETPYGHLENPAFVQSHSTGFFGLDGAESSATWGTLFAPNNGLFWFMPWTLVALAGAVVGLFRPGRRLDAGLVLVLTGVYLLFVSMVDNWRGGWTAGPRYIVPLVPFLAWWLARTFDDVVHGPQWLRGPVVTTMLVGTVCGIFACGLSAIIFPHYPEEIANPVFEIGLEMPLRGYLPPTILVFIDPMLRWPGMVCLAALGLAAAFALVSCIAGLPDGPSRTWLPGGGVVVVALLILAAQPTTRSSASAPVLAFVQRLWPQAPDECRQMARDNQIFPVFGGGLDQSLAACASSISHEEFPRLAQFLIHQSFAQQRPPVRRGRAIRAEAAPPGRAAPGTPRF
jgi:sulfite exporter TauE/SafE